MPLLDALLQDADVADFVVTPDQRVSRHELLGWAAALAEELSGKRIVAVNATPDLSTVVAVTAALLAGVPIVPIPPDAGDLERAHILNDSGAELIEAGPRRSGSVPPEPDPGLPGLVLYTSGTTGAPKGVVISRAALAADLDALAAAWQWTADDTLVHGLPLYHVHGLVLGVLGPLRIGSRLRHTTKPTPSAYAEAPGSMYFGVPTVWSRVAADPAAARALRRARLLVSGSAPLPVPVFDALAELTGQAPVERYGMTETLITVSARADGERRAGHVGLPLAGIHTRLVDEVGNPLPDDGVSIGNLQVCGPTLLDGYLRGDGVRPAELIDGWFPTGDVATIGPDGWHRIVGRASTDLIKSGGYRIGAGEVEDALLLHPAVHEAAVVGTPHLDLGEQVTAFVVADPVAPDELIAFVAERLAAHKRPRIVHLVPRLPRNAMGKVQKKQLMTG
ncbi:fatty acid CoA ligase FadD36 [Actinoplanes octamycinicus]|uniref:Fatty acid CoA ligase FadD36 n=1 Tax=Actinoplanes octamycinicus TaxID=135948 RepID=A0A7W7H7L7_9ACTN|nr:AMP-binding protein [Actinoplanes octamycinicus]MBB4745302.1 fatty acid CoA ligase FadD36 [Actinoplanes octamycinicus]GIE62219.1 acyl-CoA synthetase [Actinoplanes octamycinicus]